MFHLVSRRLSVVEVVEVSQVLSLIRFKSLRSFCPVVVSTPVGNFGLGRCRHAGTSNLDSVLKRFA